MNFPLQTIRLVNYYHLPRQEWLCPRGKIWLIISLTNRNTARFKAGWSPLGRVVELVGWFSTQSQPQPFPLNSQTLCQFWISWRVSSVVNPRYSGLCSHVSLWAKLNYVYSHMCHSTGSCAKATWNLEHGNCMQLKHDITSHTSWNMLKQLTVDDCGYQQSV